MHRLLFATKRLWLCYGRFYTPLVAEYRVTPARYDMLRIIAQEEPCGISLPEIRRLLDVSRAAVSKMTRLLEELGFVERRFDHLSKKTLCARLTDLGRKVFRKAHHYIRRKSFLQYPLENCFFFRGKPRAAVGDVIADLEELAFQFDDFSELEYPSVYPNAAILLARRHDHDPASERLPLDPRWRRRRRRPPYGQPGITNVSPFDGV